MKKIKDFIVAVLVMALIGSGVAWVYRNEQKKSRTELARRIAELNPKGGTPQTIEGLRAAIALYEQQIELNVKEGAQTGAYWKILAIRLADKGMHEDAVISLERAIYFNSEDAALFHLTGESASIIAASAKGLNSPSKAAQFSSLAESSYLRAISMDPVYGKPRLGLGVLYTFDLDRPAEAIPHLERYMELASGDVRGMFVLARAYYMTENYDRAVEIYDRIIARTKDPKIRAEAQNNKAIIRDIIYG